MKRIESRNNPTIKSINSLSSRRERETRSLFYFEGVHLLEEYIRAGNVPETVFVREDVTERYSDLLDGTGCEIIEVTDSVYDKITDEKAPQGIFTVSKLLPNVHKVGVDISFDELSALQNGVSVMLVDLQDVGNVGTVIRTAAALGCDVFLCGKCADVYSSKTVRATMGALFTNNIFVCDDTLSVIDCLKKSGKRVIAAALTDKAEVLGRFDIRENDCFVVGNEGNGLSDEVISRCDFASIIPMSGRTESLNAAMAATILLWEAKRGKLG